MAGASATAVAAAAAVGTALGEGASLSSSASTESSSRRDVGELLDDRLRGGGILGRGAGLAALDRGLGAQRAGLGLQVGDLGLELEAEHLAAHVGVGRRERAGVGPARRVVSGYSPLIHDSSRLRCALTGVFARTMAAASIWVRPGSDGSAAVPPLSVAPHDGQSVGLPV